MTTNPQSQNIFLQYRTRLVTSKFFVTLRSSQKVICRIVQEVGPSVRRWRRSLNALPCSLESNK